MYTVHKNVQIIIALLKKYGIKRVVLSAGTRHIPVVFSIENDADFECYSVVDERSAGFFALGLIQKYNEPAAVVCTSGTAACNYVSAVAEAYYQHLPLVVLTSDRNHYYLNQQEDQCVPQKNLYLDVCKRIVDLPIVRDEKDFLYCERLVNEALLELEHKEKGPVHINFQIDDNYPIEQGTFKFSENNLPEVKKIDRLLMSDSDEKWLSIISKMKESKTLIIYGQSLPLSKEDSKIIDEFCERFNCIIASDLLSNIHSKYSYNAYILSGQLSKDELNSLTPDVVITMNGNSISPIKRRVHEWHDKIEHWHVSADGEISDPYNKLTTIVESSPVSFFRKALELNNSPESNHEYYNDWMKMAEKKIINKTIDSELDFSQAFAIQALMKRIPNDSLLHIANSNSIRTANYFELDPSVKVYCNRGTCGIDGTMSSFVAQSFESDGLCFLIIGDLSFFYDMNALWNKYINPNIRILLCNNSGGGIFHSQFYKTVQNFSGIDKYVAAEHSTSAKGWVEERGFKYFGVSNKDEFNEKIDYLFDNSLEQPVLLEVFTDKDIDIRQMGVLANSVKDEKSASIRNKAASLPDPLKRTLKKIIPN